MSTETVLGTSRAWGGEADTAPNRDLAGVTPLAGATPRVPSPLALCVHIPKKGWAFFTGQLGFQHWENDQNHRLELCSVKSRSLFRTSILLARYS